jgi:uncharacterized delta-60 repeat protein
MIRFMLTLVTLLSANLCFAQQSIFDPDWNVGTGPDGPVYAVLLQTNGSILLGGSFTNFNGVPSPYLARLNPDGSLDTTFQPGANGVVNRLLQLEDGKVLVAGEFTHLRGVKRRVLARLLSGGTLDLSFDASEAYDTNEGIMTICVHSNGMILTASWETDSYWPMHRLTRLHSNGRLDTSFERQVANSFIYALLPMPDGKTLVGGGFRDFGSQNQRVLVMVNEFGQFDPTAPALFTGYTTIFSLKHLANGNILVAGQLNEPAAGGTRILAQLAPDWTWDGAFAPVYSTDGGFARDAHVQPDGKILVTGAFCQIQGHWRRHIARVDTSGVVDPCFNPTLGLGGWDGAHTLALQSDGRVIVGGNFDCSPWAGYLNLARLLPQTDCSITHAYIFGSGVSSAIVGCCPPGGTNHVQMSTNLVDWTTIDTWQEPYFATYPGAEVTNAFFRIMREP